MVVQLSILVGNAGDLLGLGYTCIEVYQSIDQGNSFQEVTAPTVQPAVLDSLPASTLFQMGGRLLKFKIDGGAEQSVDFSDIVPAWTPTQVVNRINEVVPSLASVVGSVVRLTSPSTGRTSSIEITYNDASDLGWTLGQVVYGLSARLFLSGSILIYSFPDQAGSGDDRYKWRFSANGANPISDFSAEVSGQLAPIISASNLSIGMAKFYDQSGQPVKTRILVGIDSNPQSLAGVFVSKGSSLIVDSGDDGFLQVTLMRGAKVRVAIEGTSYIREFIVPNTATFDLLTVMSTAVDPFTVQATIAQLIRRSI